MGVPAMPAVQMLLNSEKGTFTIGVTTGANTDHVDLYRGENGGAPYRIAANLIPSSNFVSYTDMAVANAVTYSYVVSAVNNSSGATNQTSGEVTGS